MHSFRPRLAFGRGIPCKWIVHQMSVMLDRYVHRGLSEAADYLLVYLNVLYVWKSMMFRRRSSNFSLRLLRDRLFWNSSTYASRENWYIGSTAARSLSTKYRVPTAHCLACMPQRQHRSSLCCLQPPAHVHVFGTFSGSDLWEKLESRGKYESCCCDLAGSSMRHGFQADRI